MNYSYQGPQVVNFRPSESHDWTRDAECAKPDKPLMFPHEGDSDGIRLAKDVCGVCPVRQQCLATAMARGESFGVWGGKTEGERRNLRRQQARKAAREQKAAK